MAQSGGGGEPVPVPEGGGVVGLLGVVGLVMGLLGLVGLSGDGDVRVESIDGVVSESRIEPAAAPAESRIWRSRLAAESAEVFALLPTESLQERARTPAESVVDCTVPAAESRYVAAGGGVVVLLGGFVRMVVSRIELSRVIMLLSRDGLGASGVVVDGEGVVGVDGLDIDGDVVDGLADGLGVDGVVDSLGVVLDGATSPPCSLLMRFRSCAPAVLAVASSAAVSAAASAVPAKGMLGRRGAASTFVRLSFMGPSWLGPAGPVRSEPRVWCVRGVAKFG